MGINYTALTSELTVDPLTRGYAGMTDQQAADSLNAVDRPNVNGPYSVLSYMLNKTHKTGTGTDQEYTNILGRLIHAAGADAGTSPFGQTDTMLLKQKHACQAVLFWLESPHAEDYDLTDTSLPLGLVNAADVFSVSQKTAIEALSQNRISRATELASDLQYSGLITVSHVATARA